MIALARVPFLVALIAAAPLGAQAPASPGGAWAIGIALGAGRAEVTTEQGRGGARNVLAMDLRLSRAVGERLRVGAHLGGWGFHPSDFNDPSKGESLSLAGLWAQLYPMASRPIFVEAALDATSYVNHAPLAPETGGSGWSVGAGYAFTVRHSLFGAVSVHRGGGTLRDVRDLLNTETGWRYRAFDLRLTGGLRLGRPRD